MPEISSGIESRTEGVSGCSGDGETLTESAARDEVALSMNSAGVTSESIPTVASEGGPPSKKSKVKGKGKGKKGSSGERKGQGL